MKKKLWKLIEPRWWQFCKRDLFGMGKNDPGPRVVGDLQLGDQKVTLNHLEVVV